MRSDKASALSPEALIGVYSDSGSSEASPAGASVESTAAASSRMVIFSNTIAGVRASPCFTAWADHLMEMMLSPPRAKKLSSRSTPVISSSFSSIDMRVASVSAEPVSAAAAGSALFSLSGAAVADTDHDGVG